MLPDTPAYTPSGATIITGLSMVTPPKPAASRTAISPSGTVTARAAWKLRQGLDNVHGLTSLPYEATNDRGWPAAATTVNCVGSEAPPTVGSSVSTVLPFVPEWFGSKWTVPWFDTTAAVVPALILVLIVMTTLAPPGIG